MNTSLTKFFWKLFCVEIFFIVLLFRTMEDKKYMEGWLQNWGHFYGDPGARREVIYPDCLPNINLQKAENANPTKSNFSFHYSKF